jgi:heme oxygenase (mycobilin-producing)
MAVKILIKRKFKDVDRKEIMTLLIKARSNAMAMKGYISTETMVSYDDPRSFIMLSMWQTRGDWDNYRQSAARQEHEQKFAEIMEGETEYEVFKMGM